MTLSALKYRFYNWYDFIRLLPQTTAAEKGEILFEKIAFIPTRSCGDSGFYCLRRRWQQQFTRFFGRIRFLHAIGSAGSHLTTLFRADLFRPQRSIFTHRCILACRHILSRGSLLRSFLKIVFLQNETAGCIKQLRGFVLNVLYFPILLIIRLFSYIMIHTLYFARNSGAHCAVPEE